MAKIYFLCGFIGSGKSTLAQHLVEREGAYVFSPDEWMIPMFGEHMPREVFDDCLQRFVGLFKTQAQRLLRLGVPVVFDFGFWQKQDREQTRDWAKQMGLDFEFVYLDTPYPTCSQRALARNAKRGEQAYEMTPEMLLLFWEKFEPPMADEWMTRIPG